LPDWHMRNISPFPG